MSELPEVREQSEVNPEVGTSSGSRIDPEESTPVESDPVIPPVTTETGANMPPKVEQTMKTETADKQNFFGQAHTVNINYGKSAEEPSDSGVFTDPTIELPGKFVTIPLPPSDKEAEQYFKELLEERVLLIECLDEDIALAATYGMIEKAEQSMVYEKRMLAFEGANAARDDLQIDLFITEKIGKGENVAIVISLNSRQFLDSMFMGHLYAQRIKEDLEKQNMLLICPVESALIREALVTRGKQKLYFPRWQIPFLSYLLRHHFLDEQKAQDIEHQLIKQREAGWWAEAESDNEFYESVAIYLRQDPTSLEAEIEERAKVSQSLDKTEFSNRNRTVQPKFLIKDDGPLKNAVVYVATFFPELSPLDFDRVVRLLAQDKKTFVDEESQIITAEQDVKVIKSKTEKEIFPIWQDNSDKIMRQCSLQTFRTETLSATIDFKYPYLRKACKRYFEQNYPMYLRQQFRRIQNSGVLFDFSASPKLIDNVIRLSAEMAISNPFYYGKDWLISFSIGLKQELNVLDEPVANEFEAFLQFLAQLKADEVRRQYFARLSELIREMLNHPQLQEMIRTFLEDLIKFRQHDIALEIVLEVTNRLRFAPQFDALYWIKRFLDQGSEDTRNKAYASLLKLAKQSGFRIYEFLENVRKWFPDADREPEKYSLSNQYALAFLIHYCSNLKFDIKHYGKWPSKYPLFATLQANSEDSDAKLNMLCQWFFHPGVKHVFGEEVLWLIADWIEEWVTILFGVKKENIQPEARQLSDALLKQIIATTKDMQQKVLIKRWRTKPGLYLAEIKEINQTITDRKQREKSRQLFIQRRTIVMELEKRFKQLQQK